MVMLQYCARMSICSCNKTKDLFSWKTKDLFSWTSELGVWVVLEDSNFKSLQEAQGKATEGDVLDWPLTTGASLCHSWSISLPF